MAAYLKGHAENSPSRDWIHLTAQPDSEWWSGKTLMEVSTANCVAYVKWRTAQTNRRWGGVEPISDQTRVTN